ncbi:MAG: methylenetetrahydrofolate--tRNA-(uracil(54)-C(5))-methyltransferase (FADH(2)-oxidizing) TrmFO, partial [Candidatus Spyradenecus sp.]
LSNASGLLKAEMRALNGLILASAEKCRVPAGGALAVDRHRFSETITETLKNHPLVEFESAVIDHIPDGPCIIATGPLTDPALTDAISQLPGAKALHFFDAAAPIVTAESLDMDKVFRASRYDRGSDYLNCPMSEDEYNAFYDALMGAELAELHDFEKKLVFEGCLAVEILASRGRQTLAFGPLKPVGLKDPRTGKEPYAVVQLRQENEAGTLYNLVGFQTRLKWGEQKRVFSMIPGLEHAEFARYGVMHRNTYLNGPDMLGPNYALKGNPLLRFAGQLSGVEGYMESTASGMTAAIGLYCAMNGRPEPDLTGRTILGALARHVSTPSANFQPMNANFGILEPLSERVRGKRNRYEKLSARAIDTLNEVIKTYDL